MHRQDKPIPHYTSRLLTVPHGMFTCAGGGSQEPFASLNLSYHVGDQPDRVRSNRARALAALRLPHLVAAQQIHSDRILRVEHPHTGKELAGYDALISNLPGAGLLIQQADCQAILLSAPRRGVVAAIHCGWRGSVLGIIGKTIRCLQEAYGVGPEELIAAISPSLGPCCAEFIHFRRELPAWMHDFQVTPHHFNFWAISRHQLIEAGVRAGNIDTAALCTRCDQQFFSYRRAAKTAGGVTGRNGSIIGLWEKTTA